ARFFIPSPCSAIITRMSEATPVDSASTPPPAQPVRLSTPVGQLPGIGPKRVLQFQRLDIKTVSDLIRHLPMRYEQEFAEASVNDLPMEGSGSARGTGSNGRWAPGGQGKGRFQATLQDHSDRIYLVWFNARYLTDQIKPGMLMRVQGKVK